MKTNLVVALLVVVCWTNVGCGTFGSIEKNGRATRSTHTHLEQVHESPNGTFWPAPNYSISIVNNTTYLLEVRMDHRNEVLDTIRPGETFRFLSWVYGASEGQPLTFSADLVIYERPEAGGRRVLIRSLDRDFIRSRCSTVEMWKVEEAGRPQVPLRVTETSTSSGVGSYGSYGGNYGGSASYGYSGDYSYHGNSGGNWTVGGNRGGGNNWTVGGGGRHR
jgi:hypothetical protein